MILSKGGDSLFWDMRYRHKIKTVVNCNEIPYEYFLKNKPNIEAIYYNTMLCVNLFTQCDVNFITGNKAYHLQENTLIIKKLYDFSQMSTDKPFDKWFLLAFFHEIVNKIDDEYCDIIQRLLKLQKEKPAVKISHYTAKSLQALWNELNNLPIEEWELRTKLNKTLSLGIIDAMDNGDAIIGVPFELGVTRVRNVINYIQSNLSGDLSVDKISEMCYCSKYNLCRVFKKHTGYTINQFVVICRVAQSVKFLYAGYSVDAAGFASGFSSVKVYIESFKAIYNITPKQFILNQNIKNKR